MKPGFRPLSVVSGALLALIRLPAPPDKAQRIIETRLSAQQRKIVDQINANLKAAGH